MTIGIMQPYFFPYIGYWQLIGAVDIFVVYDDVNFIKQGYINRNSILMNGEPHRITLETKKASSNRLINELEVGNNRKKLLKTIRLTYQKAPYFDEVFPVIKEILNNPEKNLAFYLYYSIKKIGSLLSSKAEILLSSDIEKDNALKGKNKVIEICKKLKGNRYINAIGGQELYQKKDFLSNGIELKFIKTLPVEYLQFDNAFTPNLSIIDVLMFNSKGKINEMLESYELIG